MAAVAIPSMRLVHGGRGTECTSVRDPPRRDPRTHGGPTILERIVNARYIGQESRQIGGLRQAARKTGAAVRKAELNDLVRRADSISLDMTVGALSEIVERLAPDVP